MVNIIEKMQMLLIKLRTKKAIITYHYCLLINRLTDFLMYEIQNNYMKSSTLFLMQ